MLDKKDNKILKILEKNAKLSTQQIAKKTLIPITTVHHRIKRLEKEGVIKGYTTILDNKKIGKEVSAYILITVDYNLLKHRKISQHDLAKNLKDIEGVDESSIVAGGTDILIRVRVGNIEQLDIFVTKSLRNIEGIEKTQTMIVLHEF